MAAGRHNLTRRALLGVGAAVPLAHGLHAAPACPERSRGGPTPSRWDRALAAYRRAEAELAAFRAHEKSLPPAARAYPACKPLEDRFGDLDCARLAALRCLLRAPAPDGPALALKLDLLVAEQAWELDSADATFAALRADARRLLGAADPAKAPA